MPTPTRLEIAGLTIIDVRHFFPPAGPMARARDPAGVAVHHDGVIMLPGDRDYSGTTLNEDLARLQAIANRSASQGWGTFPYHLLASPNGRTFYTADISLFGAHVAARNHQLLGAALMGNFTFAHPGDPQLCAAGRALVAIWALTQRLYDFNAHRHWALPSYPTSCCGDTWPAWQDRLLIIASALARSALPTPLTQPSLHANLPPTG